MVITCNKNCCPTVNINENSNKVIIRDDYQGHCRLNKEQLIELIINILKNDIEVREKVLSNSF